MATVDVPDIESSIARHRAIDGGGDVHRDGTLVHEATRHVRDVCRRYDVPVSEDDMVVVQAELDGAYGRIEPFGCTYTESGVEQRFDLYGEPDGYVIYLSETVHDMDGQSFYTSVFGETVAETVRHEIAHACAFESDGYTYEGVKNHRHWCERLNAEDTI